MVQSWRRCMKSMCPATLSSGPCKGDVMCLNTCKLQEEHIPCLLAGCQTTGTVHRQARMPVQRRALTIQR